ncbi:MAG: hypothetical protein K2G52_09765 [Muribaculaceae bacterium]|nr:hypothetical protein [Muribaculaceae bacterium]
MYYIGYLIIISISIFLSSCIDRHHNPQLERVSDLTETDPVVAIDSLKKINRETLDKENRHYYDFLSVKASDKAYIPHKSDTLIRSVVNYYSFDKDNPLYIESLYYAGRVYSDLGDKKLAFKYFRKALDLLPKKSGNLWLRSRLLSQSGRLLNSLHLFERARPYLREAININEIRKDTVNLSFNNQLLGSILMHDNRLDSAFIHIRKAYTLSENLSVPHKAFMRMYMAAVNINSGNVDSALYYIRPYTLDSIWLDEKSLALSYATEIYLKAGIPDTAYIYAKQLINTDDLLNKKTGYRLLLFSELESYIPRDSLKYYYKEYRYILDKYYNNRENDAAILQYTQYNYEFHERKRIWTEKINDILIYSGSILLIIVIIEAVVHVWQSSRIKKQQLILIKMLIVIKELKSALRVYYSDNHKESAQHVCPDNTDILPSESYSEENICPLKPYSSETNDEATDNEILNPENRHVSTDDISLSVDITTSGSVSANEDPPVYVNTGYEDKILSTDTEEPSHGSNLNNLENTLMSTDISKKKTLDSLQKSMRSELLRLYDPEISIAMEEQIRTSKEYEFLKEALRTGTVINEDNRFWTELRKVVCAAAPHFMERLSILTGNKLTSKDIQTALLIKCGISHSQMSVIFGRTKGTISQRKETLSKKMFGCKVDMKILEQIVRIL